MPTQEEEDKVVMICNTLIEPKIQRLDEMSQSAEIDVTEMKQILSALIGFQAGIVNCFDFDHGTDLPIPDGYESVITAAYPTTRIGERIGLAQKIGHIPAKIFGVLKRVLAKLEEEDKTSDNRTLHWIFSAMTFCFNFKPKFAQNVLHHVDHYRRLYGLYRLQKVKNINDKLYYKTGFFNAVRGL